MPNASGIVQVKICRSRVSCVLALQGMLSRADPDDSVSIHVSVSSSNPCEMRLRLQTSVTGVTIVDPKLVSKRF